MSYESTGVITLKDIQLPSKERLEKGPVAVIECPQSIPCDPCVEACPFCAISMNDINDLPKIDFEKCTGCGACIGKCPGLAVFVVDMTYSDNEALIKIPYEFNIPKIGDTVKALDRKGDVKGDAKVIRVVKEKDKTAVVSIAVKKNLAMEVRNIRC
ncbi:MAG: (4Fe-4S)-binding protein [Euryarchaeota archaeon CG_4_9_14_3_um_filter_38_12]|nr:MAG: (4Fe-4S)-binding protein [Euryarchaeota archaeon CG_4_9_14_3_um_filter_38_12]